MNIIEKFLSEKAAAEAAEKSRLAAIEEKTNEAFKELVNGLMSDDREGVRYVSEMENGDLKLEIALTDSEREVLKYYNLSARERISSLIPKIDGYRVHPIDVSYWEPYAQDIGDYLKIIYSKNK